MRRPPVTISNPRSRAFFWWIPRIIGLLAVAGGVAGGLAGVGAYIWFSRGLPDPLTVEGYRPPTVSTFHAEDGRLLGEFTTERRILVPLERMPRPLIEAFLASEDKNFFKHDGVDYRGIVRAAVANYRAGRIVEGASTLTQQLCKTQLSNEKSFVRKAKEAILARRTEHRLTKLEILELYLNQIYLGHGAYGVQAAAQNYYGKDVWQLSLAEGAMIAGLPPAPGRITPIRAWDKARARQRRVLDRMVAEGFIDQGAADAAFAETLELVVDQPDHFGELTPYFTEHARRAVMNRYGSDRLYADGLRVDLTVDADRQRMAWVALREGLLDLAERQGYTGPLKHLRPEEMPAFIKETTAHYGEAPLEPGRYYLGLVTAATGEGATVQIGAHEGRLPLKEGMGWAVPYDEESDRNDKRIRDASQALARGDVVLVRLNRGRKFEQSLTPVLALSQEPVVQGAIISMDPATGYVEAMVGGFDFDQSEYNRAFQGCRQPGSVFKPLVYSLALAQGQTLATPVPDTPIVVYDEARKTIWKPKNFGSGGKGDVLLRNALINSMNLPSIHVFNRVGGPQAVSWAQRLGITTPMVPEPSLVLGSSCVYPWDMARVYATFAQRGRAPRPAFIKRVIDREGLVLEDRTAFDDPSAPTAARLDGMMRRLFEPRRRLMDEETAFLTQTMLEGVVQAGTATMAKRLKKPAGGKTGTTDAYDAWFVGFTESLVTAVWVGADRNVRKLGRSETGGRVALPVWLRYMTRALEGVPQRAFTADPPKRIVMADIDIETGLLAGKGRRRIRLPFIEGTAPEERARAAGRFDQRDLGDVEGRF